MGGSFHPDCICAYTNGIHNKECPAHVSNRGDEQYKVKTSEPRDEVTTAMERVASILNDENNVEGCWFIRGILDSMNGEKDGPGECYEDEYEIGYDAYQRALGHR